jgi:hypothetical protein
MNVGCMHRPSFAWLVCKQRNEDCIANMCNGVEQLGYTGGLDKSKGALGWTGGLVESKEHWGGLVAWLH